MEKEVRYKGKKKSDTKGERSQIQREKEVKYKGKKKSDTMGKRSRCGKRKS
jgi:hypothetical protein